MKILAKRRIIRIKRGLQKCFSIFLAILLFVEVSYPSQVYALTGGPSQPEVQSFEPIGTSDMVDLFTGDFNYNLPLLDVDGYPINIAYHSGINTDQEASWVGLGWNINPGVINRNMRGLPDDFSGDLVTKEFNMKPNKTWGVAANMGLELFGSGLGIGFNMSYGFNFNNYNGPTVIKSTNVNISAGVGSSGSLNAGLGLTSSSDEGLTVQPSLGFSAKINTGGKSETSLGLSVGTSFNSRAGLKQVSINASASTSRASTDKSATKNSNGEYTEVSRTGKNKSSASMGNQGVGGTFDFGQPTYTPKIEFPMKNFSMSGSFTLGGEIYGMHPKVGLSGFYSAQELAKKSMSNPAYGYMYSQNGQFNDNALMDFNREKDVTFTEGTASLPLTNFTYDTYGVSGQGIGGSYRPFRGDVSYVFDNQSYTTNDNDALTAEVGIGGYVHVGTNVTMIDVLSTSGKWKSDNPALYSMTHTSKGINNDYENVYFKEANEKAVDSDPAFYDQVGKDGAVRFDANFGKFDHKLKNAFVDVHGKVIPFSGPVKRSKRDKKTQNISYIKKEDYNRFAVDSIYSTNSTVTNMISSKAKNHHMAEITTLGTDGSRYVYGIAAYNNVQKELTFAVGSTNYSLHDNNAAIANAARSGVVKYSGGSDNSGSNQKGIDNYYSKTETPAYAHSYLLTSVLTPDYIDADNVRGPSAGDYGNYTKFKYQRVKDYKWRTPFAQDSASYAEGLKSDYTDDKASVIHGEKDLYYLDSIITKNYVAVFHKSVREDAVGVKDSAGGMSGVSVKQLKLDSISLFAKRDLKTPVKRVHFRYTYDLCTKIPNNTGNSVIVDSVNINQNKGKLTLKKIYFTYQNSNRARLSPYVFDYHESVTAENPVYNTKAYDRWGNYKPNNASTIGVREAGSSGDAASFISAANLPPSDYPYVEQNPTIQNVDAAVWNLKQIKLPSGGFIKVTYESDDYAYVQNKEAGEMFKVVNYAVTPTNVDLSGNSTAVSLTPWNGKLHFKLHNGNANIADYIKGLKYVYFRFLVEIRGTPKVSRSHLEYVSGYGEIDTDASSYGVVGPVGNQLGYITLKKVNLKDNNAGTDVNPIVHAAINFGKMHLPKVVWDATSGNMSGTLSTSIIQALVNASYIKNIRDAVVGPSQTLYDNYDVGKKFVAGKSWIRLNNPDGHKLGGGLRVSKIEMNDNWNVMVGTGNGQESNYGQVYSYNLDDGRSSGVASYEPQLGGDENSMRYPYFSNIRKLMVPDDKSYMEAPFGESFYPNPSVGYSQVTVKNLPRTNVKRHATGKVVHEFYTAKDFPTITNRTAIKSKRGKDGPGSIKSLLKIDVRDYFAATQGFVIELNDMHGKPKGQKVYQEELSPGSNNSPITSIEYKYKMDPYLNGSFKLRNDCQVIDKDGSVTSKNIGVFFDMVGDFREAKTETKSTTIELNLDVIPIMGYPIPIPGIWPGFAKDKTRFRSATLTKVVQRFGLLEETVAKDLGSVVSSKNLAYDSETGDVLLTKTTNNYNDNIYQFKHPAWWYYSNMGAAYENLGVEFSNINFYGGYSTNLTASHLFREGDEIMMKSTIGPAHSLIGWVDEVNSGSIKLIKKNGSLPNGTYNITVIRSGKRNNLTTEMASITTLSDPLPSLSSNSYQNVLEASAIEYSNGRKAHCDCIYQNTTIPATSNAYVKGTKGTWRPLKTYTHLTSRSQTNINNNSNIRKDGVYEAYSPYYQLTSSGTWRANSDNWTYAKEVSEFNVFGQEVENKDALNRYSSASYGYNQTMPISMAANAKYSEQGFDGFEDYRFNPCVDDHFKLGTNDTTRTESHTGKYSMKVSSGAPKTTYKKVNLTCTTPSVCNLVLTVTPPSPGFYNALVTVTNGVAPFNYSWTVLSGAANNPQATGTTGNTITFNSGGPYIIQLNVKDDKGCSAITTINVN